MYLGHNLYLPLVQREPRTLPQALQNHNQVHGQNSSAKGRCWNEQIIPPMPSYESRIKQCKRGVITTGIKATKFC